MSPVLRGFLGVALATAVLAPCNSALSGESLIKKKNGEMEVVALPPLPAMPWLSASSTASRADVMVGPKVDDLRPFLLQPASPATQFSSVWTFEPEFRTE